MYSLMYFCVVCVFVYNNYIREVIHLRETMLGTWQGLVGGKGRGK